MRVFVALDIEEEIRQHVERFMDGVRGFSPDARWAKPESLHVTLKFVGEKSPEFVEKMKQALAAVQLEAFEVTFRGYGFFPTVNSARVFWIGVEAGPALAQLAKSVDVALSQLGVEPEAHAFNPHLTLARGAGKSGTPKRQKNDMPNQTFQQLRKRLSAMPALEFGRMTAHEFFLYQSHLGSGGAKYTKLAGFPLRAFRNQ